MYESAGEERAEWLTCILGRTERDVARRDQIAALKNCYESVCVGTALALCCSVLQYGAVH